MRTMMMVVMVFAACASDEVEPIESTSAASEFEHCSEYCVTNWCARVCDYGIEEPPIIAGPGGVCSPAANVCGDGCCTQVEYDENRCAEDCCPVDKPCLRFEDRTIYVSERPFLVVNPNSFAAAEPRCE